MKRAIYQTFFLLHTLSLDIALGAVGLGWGLLNLFTHKLNVPHSQNSSTLENASTRTLQLPPNYNYLSESITQTDSLEILNLQTPTALLKTDSLHNSPETLFSQFKFALQTEASLPILLLLLLGTLIVYWTDHLQDSKNIQMVVRDERHALFFRYRRWFEGGLGIMILAAAYIALTYLSWIQLGFGLLLLGLHAGYLLFHRKFSRTVILEKELWVGILYTLSILFVPLAICMPLSIGQTFEMLLLGLLVFLVCMQNLFSIARMEREEDEAMGARNGVLVFGELRMKTLQKLMLLLQVVSSLLLMLGAFIANIEDGVSTGKMASTIEITKLSHMASMGEMTNQSQALNTGDSTWLMPRLLAAFMIVGLVNYLLPWLFGSNRKNSWYRIVGDGVFLLFYLV